MESLKNYFTENEAEFLQYANIFKRIPKSDSEFDTELKIDLSQKHIQMSYVFGGRYKPQITDSEELFERFTPIQMEHLNFSNLRILENKFVLLEWYNPTWNIYIDCSRISVVKILNKEDIKVLDLITPEQEENLYATNSYHRPTVIFKEGPSDVVITMDKLTQSQHYEKNGNKWSFQWKIWIPKDCYKRDFSSIHYKMCLRRILNTDIAYKISSFI